MELSIIIPYYNTYEETKKLLEILIPQIDLSTEVLIIDDGCHETRLNELIFNKPNIYIWHLLENSKTASKPRNVGLDSARGKYIAFIDSDDMISEDYIKQIKSKIKKDPDIVYISWKSKKQSVIMNNKPPKWNCSVWSRVIKKSIIGNIRFREDLQIAEDWVFVHSLEPKTSESIKKQIYYYNIERPDSLMSKVRGERE